MKPGTAAGELFIGALLVIFVSSTTYALDAIQADKVIVMKDEKRLVLLQDGKILKSYAVSVGKRPGRKNRKGDGRTPEGVYVIDGRNPRSRFYKALHISYPNAFDLDAARKSGVSPGGEILIHGLPEGFEDLGLSHAVRNWTSGCIAVTNPEMDEIWRLVPVGTPVVITH